MKKIDLGQTITVLANLAVLIGVVILIVEISQNSDALAFQARTILNAGRSSQQRLIIENAGGIVDLMEKARRGDELTWGEELRLNVYYSDIIRNFEAQYREVLVGSLTEGDIPIVQWNAVLRNNYGLKDFFDERAAAETLNPELVRFIREIVLSE